jgi:glutamyl-tRNA synthetase
LQKAKLIPDPTPADVTAKVTEVVGAANERIKVAGDVLDYRDFFTPDEELPYDDAAFAKRLRKPPEAAGLLAKFRDRLASAAAFDYRALEALMNDFVQAEGIQLGQIIHAVRVAVTGKAVGFGVYETLAILGKQHSLARINRALAHLS